MAKRFDPYTMCSGCDARLIGGGWCETCWRIYVEDMRPAPPPFRRDIPPESRMRTLPVGHYTTITTLPISRGRRRWRAA